MWKPSPRKALLLIAVMLLALGAVIAAPATTPARADVTMPSWWNTHDCDTGNYPGSMALGASFWGVKVCGPGPLQGGSDHLVHFYVGRV